MTAMQPTRRRRLGIGPRGGLSWLAAPPLIYLAALFVIPILYMIAKSVFVPGFSLVEYRDALTFGANARALVRSLQVSLYATVGTTVLGSVLLCALELWPTWARRIVMLALLLPFATAGELVRIVAWIILLAPDSFVSKTLAAIGVVQPDTSLVPGMGAVVLALIHILLPFYVFTVYAATRRIDRRALRAAVSLGARPVQSVLTVYVPLAMPAFVAGSLIVFVIALGYYATPAALGGSEAVVLPILIQNQVQQVGDWPQAAALGTLLLLVAAIVLALLFRWGGLGVLYTSVNAVNTKAKRPRRIAGAWQALFCSRSYTRLTRHLGAIPGLGLIARILHALVVAALVVYLAAPLIVDIGASLSSRSLMQFPPQGVSLRWYQKFFTDANWLSATGNSLIIGAVSAVIAVALALCSALVLTRGSSRLRTPLLVLSVLPMVMPWIVVALGMFFVMNWLGIAYTIPGVILGHVVLSVPYAVIVLVAALSAFDWNLDRAAQSCGASLWARFRDVMIPLLRPALLSALLFAFIMSFSEVIFALFMSSLNMTTLPVVMWQGLTYSITPVVAAAGGVLTGTCLVAFALVAGGRYTRRLTARWRRSFDRLNDPPRVAALSEAHR